MTEVLPYGHMLGHYRIEHLIATGTFGTFYSARHGDSGDMVALKVVSVPFGVRVGIDVWALGGQACALSHSALLPVHEVRLEEAPPYVVTALASGGSLAQRLKIEQLFRVTVTDALAWLSSVGNALAYLHEQNIVHRGVQPASVLLTLTGHARLSGLDRACRLDQLVDARSITTAGYAAPEEIGGKVSALSDQYALGCIAFHLLTGEEPSQHMRRHLARCIGEQSIPAHAGRAVLRALAETPPSRFERVADFVAALGPQQT